jgi:hypothetical protein
MAFCVYCGHPTKLHVKGQPVCVDCDNKQMEEKFPKPISETEEVTHKDK